MVQGGFDSPEALGWCRILVWRCDQRPSCKVRNNLKGMNLLKCETSEQNTLRARKHLPCMSTVKVRLSFHNMKLFGCLAMNHESFHDFSFLFAAGAADFETAKHVRPSPLAPEVFSTGSRHCGMQRLDTWNFGIGFSAQKLI